MTYQFYLNASRTPQSQPIAGRQAEMIQGKSGGYAFKADLWQTLRRALIMGTATNTFYADKRELTQDFVDVLTQAVAENPFRMAAEIGLASDGRAINNSAPIFALVILSMGESPEAKQAFQKIFPKVVRTASHFYEWISYSKSVRGFGKVVRQAGQAWLSRPDVKELAYQLLKYQQRYGISHRDALRLFHVKPATPAHDALFKWVLQGWEDLPAEVPSVAMAQIWWYEWLKCHPTRTAEAIGKGRLTHEMVAPVGQMDLKAWDLLFQEMPIGALLRNLGSLTQLGVLGADNRNLGRVRAILNDPRHLRRGRIHPLDVLKALKTYQSGGALGRSRKTWVPNSRLVEILEKALMLSFDTLKPTGKVFLHAIDVSGSMSYYTVGSMGLSCCEIATVMALATAKAEKNYIIRGFAQEFRDLQITARDSFAEAMKKAHDQNFGGTDASVAYDWAIRNQVKVDLFCFWTDCESWAGQRHPSQALADYRRQVNSQAKAVYVSLVPSRLSLVDPLDAGSWDLAGFDPGIPRVIQMIATGEI